MQIYDLDDRTRIKLCNLLGQLLRSCMDAMSHYDAQAFYRRIYDDVFCCTVDVNKRIYFDNFFDDIKDVVLQAPYDDVLTLLEALAEFIDLKGLRFSQEQSGARVSVYSLLNDLFEKEYVGYRFIGNIISPISDEIEVSAVDDALQSKYEPVNKHFEKALDLLSNREKPDYENSIKESICAVEAMCEIITDIRGKNSNLGYTIKKLEEKNIHIHSSLKRGFENLYGFTCDANGFRHAGDIGGPEATFEEAKFMLVACSAFVNYLKSNMAD